MSFALKELSRLLSTGAAQIGVVVAIDGQTARLATDRGAITVRTLDTVAVGDRVQIKSGIATKVPVAKQVFPV